MDSPEPRREAASVCVAYNQSASFRSVPLEARATLARLDETWTGDQISVTAGVDQRAYWVLLAMVAGVGPTRFGRLLDRFGDAASAWNGSPLDLAAAGLDRRAIDSLLQLRRTHDPETEWRRLERLGATVLTLDDAAYPSRLREIADAPPVLYLHGALGVADEWAVAVVGTRRATAYGRGVTESLVADLARAGVTVVSGLAR